MSSTSRLAAAMAAAMAAVWAVGAVGAGAAMVSLTPSRDTTLYQNSNPEAFPLGNGQGDYLFAGVNGPNNSFQLRRGLVAFDVAQALPAGAVVDSAVLRVSVSLSPPTGRDDAFTLHRAQAAWGEGPSDAGDPEGQGAAAAPGDATWLHRFLPDLPWQSPGGDFASSPSGSAVIGRPDTYLFTGPGLAADVQAWLDDPQTNYGWFILGDESEVHNARRFGAREQSDPDNAPTLIVNYTVIPEPDTLALGLLGLAVLLLRRSNAAMNRRTP